MGGAILSAWLGSDYSAAQDEALVSVDSTEIVENDEQDFFDPRDLYVEDPAPPPEIIDILSKYDVEPLAKVTLPSAPQLVMVGVKPQIMEPVLKDLAPRIDEATLVLSIAAGKTLDDLARSLPKGTPIVRAMPNTPIMVGAGMTVLVANEFVSETQKNKLDQLLAPTGAVAWLDDEHDMDAVTALSGSGPAYLFWLAECMSKAGTEAGLDKGLAMTLAKNTIYGAGKLMTSQETAPTTLRENVTSKGGTTAAALDVLMDKEGLDPLVKKAVNAAIARSKDLSG